MYFIFKQFPQILIGVLFCEFIMLFQQHFCYFNKTKGILVPGREQLDMIYDSVCLHCVVLDSIYLDFVCLILFSLIESALIVSALIVSTLIVSTLIVSNLVVSALIMSALTFQQFKYLKKAH